jgi:hypothetical protein
MCLGNVSEKQNLIKIFEKIENLVFDYILIVGRIDEKDDSE